jgi:hypothetical protein
MSYCQTHGHFDDYSNRGCLECQHVEEELRYAVSQAAYVSANPGDYDCPHCKYRSLKAGASRCPLCRGEVASDYWNAVRAKEKVEAEAAAERKRAMQAAAAAEQIRTAPARAAAANAERKRAHNEAVKQAVVAVFLVLGGCGVFGLIACCIVAFIAFILNWNVGVSVLVTFIIALAITCWLVPVEAMRIYNGAKSR